MKAFLFYVSIFILLIGCKNEPMLDDGSDTVDINMIKTDFQRKTGYRQSDSSFINPNFKSVVDWKTFYEVGQDTLYVKVKVIDRLEVLVSDSTRIPLNDNIWVRGTRKNDKWQYSVLTFIPSSNKMVYDGIIISKSLQNGAQNISFYEANTKVPAQLVKRAGKAPAMPTDCIYGYVSGVLNEISCSGGSGDDDGSNDPPYSGDPRDYQNIPPLGDGGSGGNSDGTVPTYTSDEDKEIIDSLQGYPCAQEVLKKLPNLENKISIWLNSVFNKKTAEDERKFNIVFSASLQMSSDLDGHYIGYETSAKEVHFIKLNGNMLKTASQEYIAVTMFHEALHAFLRSEKMRLKAENKEYQFPILYPDWTAYTIGGQEKYVNKHNDFGPWMKDLQNALQTFNPSLTDIDAIALTKGGVIANMTQNEIDVNKNYKNGKVGTKCNP
ncbi:MULTISPECIES: hypothetical protein [unclassified Sphingobacterium]|uniref:hypothetical protein n=1 Tax=unclassified Sphingobacterium TaxID=2609468 RepID=UPI0025FB7A34|nr:MULTISPECIES: hypothetical protein [unclassified Sphingobacterium]